MASYRYWREALKGVFGPVHENEPQPGFWRKKMQDGSYAPVAIFADADGSLVATVGEAEVLRDPAELWTYVCRNPVTEQVYRDRVAGQPWPDEDTGVTASMAVPGPREAVLGDNDPPADPVAALKAKIDAASQNVAEYEAISTDDMAAKAQAVRSRLNELSGEADKKREEEKAPHLKASKAVDEKWQPLVKGAKATADKIKAALSAYETEKLKEQRKAEAKAAAAAPVVADAPPPPPPPPVSTTIKGSSGRAASKQAVTIVKVVDQDAVYGYLRAHPDMVALVHALAQRAWDAGRRDIPGIETEERVNVK